MSTSRDTFFTTKVIRSAPSILSTSLLCTKSFILVSSSGRIDFVFLKLKMAAFGRSVSRTSPKTSLAHFWWDDCKPTQFHKTVLGWWKMNFACFWFQMRCQSLLEFNYLHVSELFVVVSKALKYEASLSLSIARIQSYFYQLKKGIYLLTGQPSDTQSSRSGLKKNGAHWIVYQNLLPGLFPAHLKPLSLCLGSVCVFIF